ncbi:hypothetical protein GCM10009846_03520 [Agrococcus versicolor]|uniref:Uncharacterized protein n=1 Tax=Agrococcus versicolor TaxID=501482 RepID=A0ABN3AJL6_9MICO
MPIRAADPALHAAVLRTVTGRSVVAAAASGTAVVAQPAVVALLGTVDAALPARRLLARLPAGPRRIALVALPTGARATGAGSTCAGATRAGSACTGASASGSVGAAAAVGLSLRTGHRARSRRGRGREDAVPA